MRIIDGAGSTLGRLASYVAKEALKGEEIRVLNCDQIIITGNARTTQEMFERRRSMVGHSQKGPKHHATSEKLVKRAIRGMVPNFREGRGREAFKRIMCYTGIPKEFQGENFETLDTGKKNKFAQVREFTKK